MTRMDISNIYHNIRKKEYMKDESDPTSVECWYNQFPDNFIFHPKPRYYARHTIFYRHTNTLDTFHDGKVFTQQCYVYGFHI
jgi:hypothetical protein